MQRLFWIIQKQRIMEVQNLYLLSLQYECIRNLKDWSLGVHLSSRITTLSDVTPCMCGQDQRFGDNY